jgi:PHD/YefM family antitoxin component YafN of YafNO toxin-antitoxin module
MSKSRKNPESSKKSRKPARKGSKAAGERELMPPVRGKSRLTAKEMDRTFAEIRRSRLLDSPIYGPMKRAAVTELQGRGVLSELSAGPVVVTRHEVPAAVLLSIEHFEELERALVQARQVRETVEAGLDSVRSGRPAAHSEVTGGLWEQAVSRAKRAFHSEYEFYDRLGIESTNGKRGVFDNLQTNKILGLDIAVSLLEELLESSSVHKWMHGRNAFVGDRSPIDLVLEGRLAEVIRAIKAEKSGAFA